jgi:Nuclease-related domain
MEDLYWDKFLYWLIFACVFFGIAVDEWLTRWSGRVTPWFWTVITVVLVAFTVYRWFKLKPLMEQMLLGIRGERMVGRKLEELRSLGYVVFHDIPGNGFNVDHALIGPGGVFAIETNTRMKPAKGTPQVDYDGKRVLVNGFAPDRDPIAQAEAAAGFIRDLMKRTTSRDVAVRPVVLFPGWYVTRQPRGCDTWVLNEKALPKFLENEPARLSPEDIALFAERLTQHLSAT